jgi:predicted CopG family antitoxin
MLVNQSNSITELAKALSQFQSEVKQPLKDKDNPFFKSKYVPLESVVESINEIASKHGLSFTQYPLNDETGRVGVATILLHSSGEYIQYPPVFMNAEKNTAQGAGALITYLKRYALSAIFGITSDQDDDGNEASGNSTGKKKVEAEDISMDRLQDAYEALDKVQIQEKSFKTVYNELKERKFTHEMILEAINKKKTLAEKAQKETK